MSRFFINDDEWQALMGLPHMPHRLYVALRRRMDFRTGTVGARPKISYQALREDLYIEPCQGRAANESGSPKLEALRHAVKLLERAGLLRVVPADRQLIFSLILADTSESRSVEVPQINNRLTTDQEQQSESQSDQGFAEDVPQINPIAKSNEVPHTSEFGDLRKPSYSIESSSQTVNSVAVDNSPMMKDGFGKIKKASDWVPIMLELGFEQKAVGSDEAAKVFYRWFADGVLPAEVFEARRGAGSVAKTVMYLAKVVETRRLEGGGRDSQGKPLPVLSWMESWSGIVSAGAEYGLEQGKDEHAWSFKQRVFARAGLPPPVMH
ncbi:hypothetical protein [Deefgea rivuli]|uniref:hypothetical protein n=1 Tax=Deefgea rivuli TaxID=400948 RepID=UPI0006877761|nr:hypothetical protein [Deefgea rivuli]